MSRKPKTPLSALEKKKMWKQFDTEIDKDIDCV